MLEATGDSEEFSALSTRVASSLSRIICAGFRGNFLRERIHVRTSHGREPYELPSFLR